MATLDVLSNGRVVFGVGLGDSSTSFDAFGEQCEARVRSEKLDDALDVVTLLWSGDQVIHHGKHFVVEKFALTAVFYPTTANPPCG